MFCSHCGSAAADGAAFCGSCGKALAPAVQLAAAAATHQVVSPAASAQQLPTPPMAPVTPVGSATSASAGPPPTPLWLKDAALNATEWASAARVAALSLLPVIVVVTAVLGIALSVTVSHDARGSFVDWVRLGVATVCVAFGATLHLSYSEDSAHAAATLHFLPLLLTAAVVALFAWWSRRDEARHSSRGRAHLVARSAAAAAVAAVALPIVQAIFGLPGGYQNTMQDGSTTDVHISIAPLLTALLMLLVLTTTGALARAALYGRKAGTSALEVLAPPASRAAGGVDVARTWLLTMAALSVPVAVVALAIADTGGFWATTLIVAAGAGQLLAGVGVLAMFGGLAVHGSVGPFEFGGTSHETLTLFSSGVSWPWKLLLLAPVVAVALTGVRFALRRAPHLDALRAWWVTTLAVTAVSLLVDLLTRLSMSGSGAAADSSFDGGAAFGADTARLFLVSLVWGALVAVAARFLTPLLVGSAPRLARLVGGRRMHPGWMPYLDPAAALGPLVPAQADPTEPSAFPGPTPGAAPFGTGEVLAGPRPVTLSRRTKRLIVVVGGALLLVAAALVAGVQVAERTAYSPAVPVRSYLNDLGAGHVSTAAHLAHVSPTLPDSVLADPVNRIGSVHIGDVKRNGDSATVKVTYTLAGDKVSRTYELARDGSAFLGLVPRWKLDVSPTTLSVTAPTGSSVTVNGVASSTDDVAVLPGRYSVGATSPILRIDPQDVTADDGGTRSDVELTGDLTASAYAMVQQAVEDQLKACAAVAELAPPSCPFSYTTFYSGPVENVQWKIVSVPSVTTSVNNGELSFSSNGEEGTAHVTGVVKEDILGDQPIDEDVTFTLDGSASINGQSASVSFDTGN